MGDAPQVQQRQRPALAAHSWQSFLMTMDTSNFKVIKLPPNGPKPGQSMDAWLYGKDKDTERTRKIIEWREFNGKRTPR
jgi:hypothetical protein